MQRREYTNSEVQKPRSPTNILQLEMAQRRKRDKRDAKSNPHAQIRIGSQLRNRTDIPSLGHAEYSAQPAKQKANQRGPAYRQIRLVFPAGPVVAFVAAEDELLLHTDAGHELNPVAHERDKVGVNVKQVLAACETQDKLNQYQH